MGQIVSIHSYRGGTGKSNLAANVGYLAAKAGKRVAVLDSDLQAPGVHVLFGFDANGMPHTFSDFVQGKCALADAAYRVMLDHLPDSGELYLVPSRMNLEAIMRAVSEGYDAGRVNDQLMRLVDDLKLDLLLIDSQPGFTKETLLTAAISDTLLILLRPDQQDYHGTAVLAEAAARLSVPRVRFVVNKVMDGLDTQDMRGKVEQAYGQPVAGVLPFSADMARLGSREIFAVKYPRDPLTQLLGQVAEQLLEPIAAGEPKP